MKIALIVGKSYTVLTFRAHLIKSLKESGFDVTIIAQDDEKQNEIEALGVRFYCCECNNRGLSIFESINYKKKVQKILQLEKVEIAFTFQIKANIFGGYAAYKAKVPKIFSMIEGLGDAFIYNSIKWRIIRLVECVLYWFSFRHVNKVFVLNEDDKYEIKKRRIARESQLILINGIGVDLDKFSYSRVDINSNSFIMISRLLETKGIFEYCKCAELVRKTHPEAEFLLVGAEYTISKADLQKYIDNGDIKYVGAVNDVRPYIKKSLLLLLLSSYREGKPMSIMEAEAMGRGIITTNNVGCKDTVIQDYNGYIINQKDYKTAASICIQILEDKKVAEELGLNSRKFAEDKFSSTLINKEIIKIIKE